MDTNNGTKIKDILGRYPKGTVITAREMLSLGISRDLQRSFERSGWLTRIGVGAYLVLGGEINLDKALRAMQAGLGLSIHVGGYTALHEKHGKTHNMPVFRKAELFAFRGEKIPSWFVSTFKNDCRIVHTSYLPRGLGLVDEYVDGFAVKISSAERAIMEMIYLVPTVHSLRDVYQIMELLTVAKPALIDELLGSCSSIKVKRLFLFMAEEAGHAWQKRLNTGKLNLGAGVRQIEKGGKLNRKYNIILGNIREI